MQSDIQVFVRFKERSVFAGEEIQCTITFKNAGSIADNITPDMKTWQPGSWTTSGSAAENSLSKRGGGLGSQNPRLAAINNRGARKTLKSGHRTTASLSIPSTSSSMSGSTRGTAPSVTQSRPSHKHQRSVSIISLGSPDIGNEGTQRATFPPRSRSTVNHSRSASLQVHSRRSGGNYGGPSSCEHRIFASRS